MENYSIKTINGDLLKGRSWKAQNPKANLIIVTGMEEHSSRYNDFALFLNNEGFNVVCVDHYGQGDNVPDDLTGIGCVPASFFSKTVRNVDDIVKKESKNGLPTYIFGHSMGSFILQDYVQRFSTHVKKAVICGSNGPNANSLFKLGFRLAKIIVTKKKREKPAKLLARLSVGSYSKKVKKALTPFDWLSYNKTNVQKYIDDPKCGYGSTNGFYYEFLKGNARLYNEKFLKKISPKIEIFVIAGKDDPVGEFGKGPQALADMYKKYGVEKLSLKIYDNMRHEILNEENNKIVYQDIVDFLNK